MDNGHYLLDVKDLKKYFPVRSSGIISRTTGMVRAVDGVSFYIRPGETLGLVGESGCGKTTTGQVIVRLLAPTAGEIWFQDERLGRINIATADRRQLKILRRNIQLVFQDPYSSLNPRMTLQEIIGEPLLVNGVAKGQKLKDRVAEVLDIVGLRPEYMVRYPHAFSGGQRQRICIGRALALNPKFIVCDEPVSALDVSIQAQIINLLEELQKEFSLTYLFIAHDLAVVRHISDRIAVMYLGSIVEISPAAELYANPLHPYTISLLSAVPIPDPEVERARAPILLAGDIPSPANPPAACRFHTRCPFVQPTRCRDDVPPLRALEPEHLVSCHWAEQIKTGEIQPKEVEAVFVEAASATHAWEPPPD